MTSNGPRIEQRALNRLKLRQLRLLVAVGQHASIQNAARELHVSQPTATKMIQDLENDFEVPLLTRTNRGVSPTVFGESLIRHGKLIFAQVSGAARELDDLKLGIGGRVVVGTLLAASSSLLPLTIDRLLSDRPKLAIGVVDGTNKVLMPALLAGEIDLVVGRLPTHRHRDRITQEVLYDERVVAVVGRQHPLADAATPSLDRIKRFDWILPPGETTLRREIDQFFVREGHYRPSVAIESVSYLTNRALLLKRDFIALMPAHVASLDIASGVLQVLDWRVAIGKGSVGVSHRGEESLSPAGIAFLDALRLSAPTV